MFAATASANPPILPISVPGINGVMMIIALYGPRIATRAQATANHAGKSEKANSGATVAKSTDARNCNGNRQKYA